MVNDYLLSTKFHIQGDFELETHLPAHIKFPTTDMFVFLVFAVQETLIDCHYLLQGDARQ